MAIKGVPYTKRKPTEQQITKFYTWYYDFLREEMQRERSLTYQIVSRILKEQGRWKYKDRGGNIKATVNAVSINNAKPEQTSTKNNWTDGGFSE